MQRDNLSRAFGRKILSQTARAWPLYLKYSVSISKAPAYSLSKLIFACCGAGGWAGPRDPKRNPEVGVWWRKNGVPGRGLWAKVKRNGERAARWSMRTPGEPPKAQTRVSEPRVRGARYRRKIGRKIGEESKFR